MGRAALTKVAAVLALCSAALAACSSRSSEDPRLEVEAPDGGVAYAPACAAITETPEIIATNVSEEGGLFLDDDALYYVTREGVGAEVDSVWRWPLRDATSTFIADGDRIRHVQAISPWVFWLGGIPPQVYYAHDSGGVPQPIGGEELGLDALVADETGLYASGGVSAAYTTIYSLQASDATIVATSATVSALATSTTYVYYVWNPFTENEFHLARAAKDGSTGEQTLEDGLWPELLAVDDTHVYFALGDYYDMTIARRGRAAGETAAREELFELHGSRVRQLVPHGRCLYVVGGGGVQRTALDGKAALAPIDAKPATSLVVDSTHAYWIREDGALLRVPLTATSSP
jgi:hypothetical protein